MKIVLVYICVTHGIKTHEFAARFVGTWLATPPGVDCQLVIACNGGPLDFELAMLFAPLNPIYFPRENDAGFDISAYADVAAQIPSDMQFCAGESVYAHREGWLLKIVQAWERFGPGMYGCYSSNLIRAHLNTTAFACAPKFLRNYPKVTNRSERYEYEHGRTALWRRLAQFGTPTKLVTWDGTWDPRQWRTPPNILTRGDQSNLLVWCNHTDRYRAADFRTKLSWAAASDSVFQ